MDTPRLLSRLLDVIEFDLAPLSATRIREGDKIFGGAILRKDDLSLIVAETNNETANPLWHGEMHAIKRFFELPETLPVMVEFIVSPEEADKMLELVRAEKIHCFATRTPTEAIVIDGR